MRIFFIVVGLIAVCTYLARCLMAWAVSSIVERGRRTEKPRSPYSYPETE